MSWLKKWQSEWRPKPRGFQVGDRVIVVRNPNDDADTVLDFDCVYGRMGMIAEKPCKDDESYDYTVKFDDWGEGWHIDAPHKSGSYWGIYHKNLRRVSKIDEPRT